jgi:peptidoglycan/xylan/chitin deacetylase (PgdA/CDA1 family)
MNLSTSISSGPRYILRFDDACPTMNWDVWNEIESILLETGVAPVIAVVPDNQDPELQIAPPVEDFWDRVRSWQARGWSIALHGYQHHYVTKESGLIGMNNYSEFAGLPESVQAKKIQKGLAIFESEGVTADTWIAPAHSFDQTTLRVLANNGLLFVSDGYSRWPYLDQHGIFWVPQQFCWFTPCRSGVWTVCFHCNHWTRELLDRFRRDLLAYREEISTLTEITAQFHGRHHSLSDTVHAVFYGNLLTSRYKQIRRLGSRIVSFRGNLRS